MTATHQFELRMPKADLRKWCEAYEYKAEETQVVDELRPKILHRGYMTRDEFVRICEWKSPRTKPLCARNGARPIEVLTRVSFAASDEATKMDLLRLLEGVDWPTASTLLHFGDQREYPILDFRALWSLGYAKPPVYTMGFWLSYLAFTRELAAMQGMSVRDLDKALWQYSRVRQSKAK